MTLQTPDEPDRLTTDLADMLAELRDLSGRMARFEPVTQEEIDAFHARKRDIIDVLDIMQDLVGLLRRAATLLEESNQ